MSEEKQSMPETLSWRANAFQKHHRSRGWYLGLIVAGIGLITFAIYTRSIITLITFALIILVIFTLSLQRPQVTIYRITKTGISVGKVSYPYKIIKLFWIVYNPPEVKTLNFETTAYINNQVSLQLENQDPVMVKRVLSQYLPEDINREESVSEALARRLKI